MPRHRAFRIFVATGLLVTCVSCFDPVVSFYPWFETDESDSADLVFDAKLLGLWCIDDEGCPGDESCAGDEVVRWTSGPGDSYNVFMEDRLAFRAWLGEIDGTLFLDFMFLCEPSLGTGDDVCDTPVGSHFVARVGRLEYEVVEFSFLEVRRFEEVLEAEEEPMVHGRPYGDVVLVDETEKLRDFLAGSGRADDLWGETICMTLAK